MSHTVNFAAAALLLACLPAFAAEESGTPAAPAPEATAPQAAAPAEGGAPAAKERSVTS